MGQSQEGYRVVVTDRRSYEWLLDQVTTRLVATDAFLIVAKEPRAVMKVRRLQRDNPGLRVSVFIEEDSREREAMALVATRRSDVGLAFGPGHMGGPPEVFVSYA
jgi:hypothetical protein